MTNTESRQSRPRTRLVRRGTGRVHFLDEVRGFAILCMVMYHLGYSLDGIFDFSLPFMHTWWMNALRDLFVGIFVLVSGMACNFSKSNVKRGFFTLCAGLLITAATYFVMPSQLIIFGILHMLGVCMILYGLLKKPFGRVPIKIGLPVLAVLFALTFCTKYGYFGFPGFALPYPQILNELQFLYPLGFAGRSFFSADYFPLLPWVFLFFAGGLLGRGIGTGGWPDFFYKMHCKFFAVTGRYTIWIYLLHQPVILGVLYLIFQ